MASSNRKSAGRQKVEMVRIEKETNRLVTFSKRRAGLFKNASELCTLCGVAVASIVFSPGRKAFSFGHPDIEVILDRYHGINCPRPLAEPMNIGSADQLVQAQHDANVCELNIRLTFFNSYNEVETKRGEELKKLKGAKNDELWWLVAMDNIEPTRRLELQKALRELKIDVIHHRDNLQMQMEFGSSSGVGSFIEAFYPMVGMNSSSDILASTGFQAHSSFNALRLPPPPMDLGPIEAIRETLPQLQPSTFINPMASFVVPSSSTGTIPFMTIQEYRS